MKKRGKKIVVSVIALILGVVLFKGIRNAEA